MDVAFGDTNNRYNVVMEYAPERDPGDATIYCEGGTNYAYIGYGVNLKSPGKTYLAYRLNSPNTSYDFINFQYARGKGLSASQGNTITKVIKEVDGQLPCDCSRTA